MSSSFNLVLLVGIMSDTDYLAKNNFRDGYINILERYRINKTAKIYPLNIFKIHAKSLSNALVEAFSCISDHILRRDRQKY